MKILYEMIPEFIKNRRQLWSNKRDAWYTKVQKEEEFYYQNVEGTGTNYTLNQLKRIDKGSGIPVAINFLYPILNQKLAILAQTKPTIRAVGLDERGKKYASVIDKAIKSIMYNSEATGEEEECTKNMLMMGIGITGIEELDYYQFGTFNLAYVNIHPSIVILDSNSKKRNLQDMQGYFVEKEITLEEAEDKYGFLIERINSKRSEAGEPLIDLKMFSTSGSTIVSEKGKVDTYGFQDRVLVSEYYTKTFSTAYYVKNFDTGNIDVLFEENLEEDQTFLLANPLDTEKNKFVKKSLMLGNYLVAEEIKSIKEYQLKAKFFEWGGSPYNSFGMLHYVIGMQEAIDNAFQTMLINGMLTNNAGYISPKGAITPEDKSKWEELGSKPGVIKEYNGIPIGNTISKPEKEQIQQVSNYFPMLIEMLKGGMEYSTGINSMTMGNAQDAKVEVFSSLQQYQNAAMQRIQLAMAHINLANEQLGNVLIDMLIANLNPEQNYVFFDNENNLQELNVVQELIEDFKLGKYKILSVASEAMPTQKLAMSTELFKIAQTTPDPMDRNIYIQEAYKLSDMRGFDSIQEKVDVKNKLSNQVQQLQEELDRSLEIQKQLENRTINAELKARISQRIGEAETSIGETEVKSKMEIEIEKLKEQIKELKKPVDKNN